MIYLKVNSIEQLDDCECNPINCQLPSTSIQCTKTTNCIANDPDAIELLDDKMEKVDIIGRINGDFGKWQLRTVLLIFLCKIPSAWFMACIIFTAPAARSGEFFCRPSTTVLNADDRFQRLLNLNKTAWLRLSHPTRIDDGGEEVIDFCNTYSDAHQITERYFHSLGALAEDWIGATRNSSEIVPCEEFYHHTEYTSLITDYNLVCSKDILVASTQFFHLFGVLTGGLLATYLLKQ